MTNARNLSVDDIVKRVVPSADLQIHVIAYKVKRDTCRDYHCSLLKNGNSPKRSPRW